jgi:hypothetical protein
MHGTAMFELQRDVVRAVAAPDSLPTSILDRTASRCWTDRGSPGLVVFDSPHGHL